MRDPVGADAASMETKIPSAQCGRARTAGASFSGQSVVDAAKCTKTRVPGVEAFLRAFPDRVRFPRGTAQGALRGKQSRQRNGGCNSERRHKDRRGDGLRGQNENRVPSLPRLLWPIPSRCASCVPRGPSCVPVSPFSMLAGVQACQTLTDAATARGFYDAKNARLCHVFEGQGLTHREPALDEQDFERYVKSLFPLMVAGRDVLWVLGGRTDTNRGKCCTFATT
jgi:hypothetical protein